MDSKKDITNSELGGNKNIKEYVANKDFFFAVTKRTEKLSSALYLVTNLVSDTEPLKWELRSRGLELLSDICALGIGSMEERAVFFSRTQNAIIEIISLLEIGRVGALISDMNCAILKREYGILSNILQEGEQIKSPAEKFVSELFKEEERLSSDTVHNRNEGYKGHQDVLYKNRNDNVPYGKLSVSFSANRAGVVAKRNIKDISRGRDAVAVERQNRKNLIIELVKKEKEITIKDAMSVIKGCSEKTIQRELGVLVSDNVLKKEGKKRWSRYSLK